MPAASRISSAALAVGSALSVKPVLTLVDGRLEVLDRVRTSSKALARLQEIAVQAIQAQIEDGHGVSLAVHHLAAPQRAEELAAALSEVLAAHGPTLEIPISEVGAVVGAHTGPGLVAVILAPRVGH